MTIQEKVDLILSDRLGVDMDKVFKTDSITNDLGADSLDAVQIIMDCEETFGIEIANEVMDKVETVADLIKAVETAVVANNGQAI